MLGGPAVRKVQQEQSQVRLVLGVRLERRTNCWADDGAHTAGGYLVVFWRVGAELPSGSEARGAQPL